MKTFKACYFTTGLVILSIIINIATGNYVAAVWAMATLVLYWLNVSIMNKLKSCQEKMRKTKN